MMTEQYPGGQLESQKSQMHDAEIIYVVLNKKGKVMREARLKGIPTFSWDSLAKACGLEHPPPFKAKTTSGNSQGDQNDGNVTS